MSMEETEDLLPRLEVPPDALCRIMAGDYPEHTTIAKERLGAKRACKTLSSKEWDRVRYDVLEEIGEWRSEHAEAYMGLSAWLNLQYSVAFITRMIASIDPEFNISRRQRRALAVIFENILHKGEMTRKCSGNTLIMREALTKFLLNKGLDYAGHWVSKSREFGVSSEDAEGGKEILEFEEREIDEILDFAIAKGILGQGLYNGEAALYSKAYAAKEQELLSVLLRKTSKHYPDAAPGPDSILSKEQREMFYTVMSTPTVGVINNGRPGTGKTTTACGYISETDPKTWLALATTGVAAAVLAESLPEGVSTSTISWAAFNTTKLPKFTKIIVDECSMLNMHFISQLLRVIDSAKELERVVLLGDPDQLPPVGVGAFFSTFNKNRTFGVSYCEFEEQHRMTPSAMHNLLPLTRATEPTLKNLFGFPYGDCSFRTVESSGQSVKHGNVSDVLIALIDAAKSDIFSESYMRQKSTRTVVSTFKKTWARFYSEFVEAVRRKSDTLKDFEDRWNQLCDKVRKLPPPSGVKHYKQSGGFAVYELMDTVLSDKALPSRYRELSTEVESLKDSIKKMSTELRANWSEPGIFCRANKNIWTTKISDTALTSLTAKFRIKSVTGDIANGTKFITKELSDGTIVFEGCDSPCTIVFEDTADPGKLMSLAWVQTTHKLQGDQGAHAIFIADKEAPLSLFYVGLSRGRKTNTLLTHVPLWAACPASLNFTRLSTLLLEENA